MGGFDIYCYKCGVPICDLRNYKKNINPILIKIKPIKS